MSSSALNRDGGLSDIWDGIRDGVLTGLRMGLGPVRDAEAVRSPVRLILNDCGAVRGDSARGTDGRLLVTRGRETEGLGPTDLLKLTGGREGVVGGMLGVGGALRLVTYLFPLTGTKIPEFGVDVMKYFRPSTSPLFFPRRAYSALSSTPANFPGFPATVPRYRTVPCMPPGTFTRSPTWMSSSAILAQGTYLCGK